MQSKLIIMKAELNIAIATSFWVSPSYFPSSCGITKWCYSAKALAAAPFLYGLAEVGSALAC